MEHVVFFPGPDASASFRRFPSLDEAVRFVEHLRNAEGVSEVSLHALTAVPLAFRTYVKVEVPGAEAEAAAEPALADVPEQPAPVEPVTEAVPELQPVMAEVATVEPEPSSNGKRSLGFFAH